MWKKFKTYVLETPGEKITIRGCSTAAKHTAYYVENRNLMLDCGVGGDYNPSAVFITHLHLDHIKEVVSYILNAVENGTCVKIFSPIGTLSNLETFIEATFRATKFIPKGKVVPLPPHMLVGAKIDPSDCTCIFDVTGHTVEIAGWETTTYTYPMAPVPSPEESKSDEPKDTSIVDVEDTIDPTTDHSSVVSIDGEEKVDAETDGAPVVETKIDDDILTMRKGKIDSMKKPWVVEAIRCNHSQPTSGYGFSEQRSQMKDEYMAVNDKGKRVCTITPEEFKRRKEEGTMDELKETVNVPLFCFLGDTDHKVFLSNEKFEGWRLDKYPVIIVECTFYKDEDKRKAKKDKHMHWSNLKPYIVAHPDKYFKLIHFSARITSEQFREWEAEIKRDFPTAKGDTPHVVLLR